MTFGELLHFGPVKSLLLNVGSDPEHIADVLSYCLVQQLIDGKVKLRKPVVVHCIKN